MNIQPLLVALISENNDIRQQAEKSLNDEWLQNASDQLLLQLATQTRVAESETVLQVNELFDVRFDLLLWSCCVESLSRRTRRKTMLKQFGVHPLKQLNNKSKQPY
jgi:hypothetical protein